MTTPWYTLLVLALSVTLAPAQQGPTSMALTNSERTLAALSVVRNLAMRSLVKILDETGKTVLLGTVVSADGYILTKASEAPAGKRVRVALPDGTQEPARVVTSNLGLDLLLLSIGKDGTPLPLGKPSPLDQGDWVASFSATDAAALPLRLGCVSAKRRAIPGQGAGMGISMENEGNGQGVRIIGVASESPAESAGLREDDVLVAIDNQIVADMQSVQQAMASSQPGTQMRLRVRRGQLERECHLRLASRSKLISNWEGEDYANGGVSLRTDDFPEVLQHQLPLGPTDMGGPLLNLDGQAVGINIARVDRVTNFALPTEVFWNKVQEWMVADRKTRAATRASSN